LKEVFEIYKPVMSSELENDKKKVIEQIAEFVEKISLFFEPIFQSYFNNTLSTFLTKLTGTTSPSNSDMTFMSEFVEPINRINRPEEFTWNKMVSVLESVSKLPFQTMRDKDTAVELYSISKFISKFREELLTMFTFNKNKGGNYGEIIESESSALNTDSGIEMLYNNTTYLNIMLVEFYESIQNVLKTKIVSPQSIKFESDFSVLIEVVKKLKKDVESFHLNFETTSYKTILGEPSHAVFVENIFYEKVPNISNANRNNKFLVVSDFITNVDGNKPVTITIPSGYYDLETLGKAIEKELCNNCKWQVDAIVENKTVNTIWSCKYDENNKMQLKLYFPNDVLMNNNNIIPNIHDAYPVGYNGITAPNNIANNRLNVKVDLNMNGATPNYSTNYYTLVIPQGEYTSIEQLLGAMENTVNDFIREKKYKAKIEIIKDETSPNNIKFKFSKPFYSRKNEYLIINFDSSSSLNDIIGADSSAHAL